MVGNSRIFSKLLIVITRMYGRKGSKDDEYVHEWGRPEKENFFLESAEDKESEIMLFLHGCDEHGKSGYKRFLVEAQEEYLLAPSNTKQPDIMICHHGPYVESGEIDSLREKVKELYPHSKIDTIEYGGGGVHAAVAGLRKRLKEIDSSYADEVLKVAKGSAFFVFLLHHFQQCLLGLYLYLSILISYPDLVSDPKDEQNKKILELYRSYKKKIGEVFEGVELIKYLDLLKNNISNQKEIGLTKEDIDRFFWWWKVPDQEEEDLELGTSLESSTSPQSDSIKDLFFGEIAPIIKNGEHTEKLLKELQSELRLQSQSLDRIIYMVNTGIKFN